MTAWQFTTDAFAQDERLPAWREVLDRLYLPVGQLPEENNFHAEVIQHVSPLGIVFMLFESEAMTIAGKYSDQPDAIWLCVMLEGSAEIQDGACTYTLRRGDILYGPTGIEASMRFPGPVRQLIVRAPRLALNPRVVMPLSLKLGRMSGQTGIQRVLLGMLLSLAEVLPDIKPEELRPLEIAVTEFLMASLVDEKAVFGLGGAAAMKSAHLHRICQDIESRLSESDLSLATIAASSGVSTRYLQKLFTTEKKSFSGYVRTRRLERCKADLASPLHRKLSISEICFRWGFNGSAHFSRIFRNAYGVSPRDFRRSAGTANTEDDASGDMASTRNGHAAPTHLPEGI